MRDWVTKWCTPTQMQILRAASRERFHARRSCGFFGSSFAGMFALCGQARWLPHIRRAPISNGSGWSIIIQNNSSFIIIIHLPELKLLCDNVPHYPSFEWGRDVRLLKIYPQNVKGQMGNSSTEGVNVTSDTSGLHQVAILEDDPQAVSQNHHWSVPFPATPRHFQLCHSALRQGQCHHVLCRLGRPLFCPCIWPLWPVHPLRHLLWHFWTLLLPLPRQRKSPPRKPHPVLLGLFDSEKPVQLGYYKIIICFFWSKLAWSKVCQPNLAHVSFTSTSIWRGSWFENKNK